MYSENREVKKMHMKRLFKPAAAAAAFLCCIMTAACAAPAVSAGLAIAGAVYPEMADYPDESQYTNVLGDIDFTALETAYDAWQADRDAQLAQPAGYADGLAAFTGESAKQFLTGDDGENRVYSPLNIYMALAMLAELTGGESRAQVLSALGVDDIEALRVKAAALWNACYRDDGIVTSVLANSVWLNENVNFVQSTMDTLAGTYYASSFSGAPGSAEFDAALQSWLNEQTGGLLEEQAKNITLDADVVLALASAVYFRAGWSSEFSEGATADGVFHAAGGDVACPFMHQSMTATYYTGDGFSAVCLGLKMSGGMWLILPDEGVTPEQLIESGAAAEFVYADKETVDNRYITVDVSLPRFDVSGSIDLAGGLRALGVTDVFDPNVSDFSPMTADADRIFVSSAAHAARVSVDEEGCTAAAFTVLAESTSCMPPEERVDFALDRPFIFAVTNEVGLALFMGVVNDAA